MSAPTTQKQWWALYEANIDNIYECAVKTNVKVTEEDLVLWHEDSDDNTAISVLNHIWDLAPDEPIIHTWPGWANICLLNSEYDALFLEEYGEEEDIEEDVLDPDED